jgi:hypothetical protein
MSGVETILGRVLDREERNTDESGGESVVQRHFVEIPRDLASCGVVYVVVLRGETEMGDVRMDDGSVIAGPAISTFPFDAGSSLHLHCGGMKLSLRRDGGWVLDNID